MWRWLRVWRGRLEKMVDGDAQSFHDALINQLEREGWLRTSAIAAAFRALPRHLFLPSVALKMVYEDDAVVTHYDAQQHPISSSSQPSLMAAMLALLDLQPGQHVLEIGVGTGYNAALIAHVVGANGQVTSVDIDAQVVHEARSHLLNAGMTAVDVVQGDGALGWPSRAPFDRIILTVGAFDVKPAWREQLVEGGRLVIPLTLRCTPYVFAFQRVGDQLVSVGGTPGGFMHLRGLGAPIRYERSISTVPSLRLWSDHAGQSAEEDAYIGAHMAEPFVDLPSGVEVSARELTVWSDWAMWLELMEPDFIQLHLLPTGQERKRPSVRSGLSARGQIALVVWPNKNDALNQMLLVRAYEGCRAMADQLIAALQRWSAAGRPRLADLRVIAVPAGAELPTGWQMLHRQTASFGVQFRALPDDSEI